MLEHAPTSQGGTETSVLRPSGRGIMIGRKAALMLQTYAANVALISETK